VKRLQEAFPSVRFAFSDIDDAPDFVLAVCGCPVACAAREDANTNNRACGPGGQFAVTSQNDFTKVRDEIRRAEALL
jgi:hypothetical protein